MSQLSEVIKKHGIEISSAFVPWSKSRNYKEGADLNEKSLNWKVTLLKDSRGILTTDYSAGIGHCPFYNKAKGLKTSLHNVEAFDLELEEGFEVIEKLYGFSQNKKSPILPKTEDVIYSLVMDSEVLNYSSFEDWAESFGFDPDSRKAEKIYQQCLQIGLAMLNNLGHDVLNGLKEAAQEY